MTKQEKIREGIYELLKEYGLYNWDMRNRVSSAIMEHLDSVGVVIKKRDVAGHTSDCSVYNEPAYPNEPCDCGGLITSEPLI